MDLGVGDNVGIKSVDGVNGEGDKVPDFNSGFGGSSDPLEFGVEGDLVDLGLGVEFSGWGRQVSDVPDVEFSVSSSGGDVFSVVG